MGLNEWDEADKREKRQGQRKLYERAKQKGKDGNRDETVMKTKKI